MPHPDPEREDLPAELVLLPTVPELRRLHDRYRLVIGRFPTKEVARETATAFADAGSGSVEDFRVERSKGPDDVG